MVFRIIEDDDALRFVWRVQALYISNSFFIIILYYFAINTSLIWRVSLGDLRSYFV
jgi:hypothetical protein